MLFIKILKIKIIFNLNKKYLILIQKIKLFMVSKLLNLIKKNLFLKKEDIPKLLEQFLYLGLLNLLIKMLLKNNLIDGLSEQKGKPN